MCLQLLVDRGDGEIELAGQLAAETLCGVTAVARLCA
jgi:hypothetical protein